jgi:hypothetical protein
LNWPAEPKPATAFVIELPAEPKPATAFVIELARRAEARYGGRRLVTPA